MRIAFTKMHGNGNDFVLIDEFEGVIVGEEEKPRFVRAVCHRNFGVGADGALFVQPSQKADVRFRYFNSDGSEAAMCGNGIRCFSRYVVEEGYAGERLRVETLAGILELEVKRENGWWVKVDMGKPKFGREEIPAKTDVWGYEVEHDGRKFRIYAANTGVPHVAVFVDSLDFDIVPLARKIRYSEIFPEGTNVNFAKVDGDTITVRTYERGVEGETLSCGTGSVAVAAIANRLGLTGSKVDVVTKGGLLKIELTEDTAYMTGGASRVFDGILRLNELRYDI
ncbi:MULTISPECIES: diaminopimelate epimerase [Archaeoglobus]|jgi:diaminopimelate epimerase|uniref:Diaminopimelate epimerase n=3 Tax=Archaeoglobus fulgidus TaxID=2234 RepID=DAPF_ARCFU|nr:MULTISPECIES: diaminopimelate epimerase [Archaeoglobus]O29511.1 RecName: Full=Diaminopimelate epimerase; Short=DAP epimerase; AltName: Full=PLP-independent amino acid racemase [Archaeoglobus fulgidus DSM 4304]AAB90492.1 diaminopimelate epimerase (dapF) [Archaeoglobus fulgidus DSM 4304]AIG97623.1 diaminopimelate epimerase [Archaeoglobus fulgidus DSM 8774]KUJ93518.1 MAG: Diaminopimelate epimerase [Archaeoglobus fulgidus]KUK07117.1 MAG: Diaminopimelate epimerase [Archaeoglobus fulgidus]MDI349